MLWISSTENKQWQEEENFINEKGIEIVIGAEKGKPIYGFGACFSELGIKAISSLDGEKRRAVYDDFFGKDGCGFSFCIHSSFSRLLWLFEVFCFSIQILKLFVLVL